MALLMRYMMAVVVSLALLMARAMPAAGHAAPVTMDPPGGAVLETVPAEVRFQFSQPVEIKFSQVEVRSDGQLVGDPSALRLEGSRTLIWPLPPLRPGRYDVKWRVLSTDGHVTEGSYWFKVAEGAKGSIAPGGVGAPEEPAARNWALYALGAMIVSFLALIVLSMARKRRQTPW